MYCSMQFFLKVIAVSISGLTRSVLSRHSRLLFPLVILIGWFTISLLLELCNVERWSLAHSWAVVCLHTKMWGSLSPSLSSLSPFLAFFFIFALQFHWFHRHRYSYHSSSFSFFVFYQSLYQWQHGSWEWIKWSPEPHRCVSRTIIELKVETESSVW